jgi:hypothetical protein
MLYYSYYAIISSSAYETKEKIQNNHHGNDDEPKKSKQQNKKNTKKMYPYRELNPGQGCERPLCLPLHHTGDNSTEIKNYLYTQPDETKTSCKTHHAKNNTTRQYTKKKLGLQKIQRAKSGSRTHEKSILSRPP